MKIAIKDIGDFLTLERSRNDKAAALFTEMIREACEGSCQVIIGHHLTFEFAGELSTENEIPSADTLLFNHAFMTAIFGDKATAVTVMIALAQVPCTERDVLAAQLLQEHKNTARNANLDAP